MQGTQENQKAAMNNYETASDSSERCFQEKYSGDSRKWIIRDASYKLPKGPLMSTMKDEYRVPLKEEQRARTGQFLYFCSLFPFSLKESAHSSPL